MVVDGAVVMVENIVRHMGRHSDVPKTPMERIREAAHEVQRPVFYAIAIIITAYLPIFTLQRVEGRLFKPMAWTVAFALLGALIFSMLLAPVLASLLFRRNVTRVAQSGIDVPDELVPEAACGCAIEARWVTVGLAVGALAVAVYLATSGMIGSEFLPHLDEGAIWVRGTLAPSTGPDEGMRVANQARLLLAAFPEATGGHQPGGPPGRRHGYHRLLQHRIFRRSETEGTVAARFPAGQRRTDRAP